MHDIEAPSTKAQGDGLGPLSVFAGARPDAPDWFVNAVAQRPERLTVDLAGAAIETIAWGPVGAPGLLLLHGNGAHAGWWDFIAPALSNRYRVAAVSWSGMGASAWRDNYSLDLFVEELMAGATAAGLFEPVIPPVAAAHSFGGFPALAAAARHGQRFRGVITIDSPIFPPGAGDEGPPKRSRPNRVYPTLAEALARFRLAPPQPCANAYILDHIARGALAAVDGGFSWRFDPFLWTRLADRAMQPRPQDARCRLGVIWGEDSVLCTPSVIAHMRTLYPTDTPFVGVANAAHHVQLDQPLAFIEALAEMIEAF